MKNLKSLASATVLSEELGVFSEIINELYKVSSLSIVGACFEGLVASGSLSKLQCLTHLDLAPSSKDEFRMLPRLFDGTPNLQQLTLDMVKPLCLAQKLRKVEVFDFVDSETQFNVAEYLLEHGALLEFMSFRFVV